MPAELRLAGLRRMLLCVFFRDTTILFSAEERLWSRKNLKIF